MDPVDAPLHATLVTAFVLVNCVGCVNVVPVDASKSITQDVLAASLTEI